MKARQLGRLRRFLFLPGSWKWNAWVRDLTARLGVLALILITSTSTSAQTTMQYEVDWFFVGALAPFMPGSIMGNDSACVDGVPLPPVPPGNVVNPGLMHLEHDWDADGDLDICTFDLTLTVRPFLPGEYFGRARARSLLDTTLVSGGSADSNRFFAAGVPADPQGFVIVRGGGGP